MAGILDSKTRIIDYQLTDEGRRRLSEGNLQFRYASFSDTNTFYEADIVSGSSDASTRIFLEVHTSIAKDKFIPVTDDSGQLVPHNFKNENIYTTTDGTLFVSGTSALGQQFSSLTTEAVENIGERFSELRLLSTSDYFDDDPGFEISPTNFTFNITNKLPIDVKSDITTAAVDSLESFVLDSRMAHVSNFKYLPPIDVNTGEEIGSYQSFVARGVTSTELNKSLSKKECVDITFPKNSKTGNIVAQIYESANGKLTKLDVLRFKDTLALDGQETYFVGKVFIDSTGNGNFVNQFVLRFNR